MLRTGINSGWRVALFALLLALNLSSVVAAAENEPMLPQTDSGTTHIRGWLMSEKLDGVRAFWDGRRLWSKNHNPFSPPPEFTHGLPPFALEGELWGGHGTFHRTVSTVRKLESHPGWLQLRFGIFDVPHAPGGFTRRLAKAQDWFTAHPSIYAFVIPQKPVRDRKELRQELKRIEQRGGEGLIVRKPDALYISGRNTEILKVKSYQDAEARVIEQLPGKGRNAGRLGSLLVELENGTRFKIGSGFSDAERDNPPAPGSMITFKYYGTHPSGVPRFPAFLRIRSDQTL